MMGVVLCEFSGVVSAAMRAAGLPCYSCDILPTEGDPRWHIQHDAREVAYDRRWDWAIMHPDCTKLANSGSKHLYIGGKKKNGIYWPRWEEVEEGAHFYRTLRDAPIEFKAVENPVMHGEAIKATRRGLTKFYHPHHFGDPFFKLTGLELIGFPPLVRTHYMVLPKPGTPRHHRWSKVHRMQPGEDRGLERARFEPGFAQAMANQWGAFLRGVRPMSDFWKGETAAIVKAMKATGNRPGVVSQWKEAVAQWAQMHRTDPNAAAVNAWLPVWRPRPFYTAEELAPMWPALAIAVGHTAHWPNVLKSPRRLEFELDFAGLPHFEMQGRRYYIVEQIHFWQNATQEERENAHG